MTIEVKVPALPESVADATVVTWHKKVGEIVTRDEHLVDLETDKVVLEVTSPTEGILKEIIQQTGSLVTANELLALIEEGAAPADSPAKTDIKEQVAVQPKAINAAPDLSPAARRLAAEKEIDASSITGTGKAGRVTREDIQSYSNNQNDLAQSSDLLTAGNNQRVEKRVPMSRLRARIAERLLQAQHNAAMLTTFNEINLKAVIDLRTRYKDTFEKSHKTRLGFMSFFTKAAIEALKRFPAVNASIDNNDIVYHGYYDVGIAVSTERGLVVPVLRDADQLSMAEIEASISEYANKAKEGKLSIEEMTGGTFTITNGGVFGSLLATPILNPPQSAILGMHKIEQRPIVEDGEIVIRPMMYVALSYDHRIIDGRESVSFLVTIKELLEDPARLLLGV